MESDDAISKFEVMKLSDELMLFGRVSGVKIEEFRAIISDTKWCEQPTLTKVSQNTNTSMKQASKNTANPNDS